MALLFEPLSTRIRAAECAVLLLALAGTAGCNSGSGGSGDASGAFGLSKRQIPTLHFPRHAPRTVALEAVPAFPNLSFASPVFLAAPPDATGRLFVVEQDGKIEVFLNSPEATSTSTFLDIAPRVKAGGEEGLLGLAFDPDFATNGRFYVNYTTSGPNRTVVSRFTVSGDPDRADPDSEEVLLEVGQPDSNHNGGMITFGPDGHLYIAFGDGGGDGDPQGHAQNLGTLLGTLLRIDPRGGTPYAVPADNPHVGDSGAMPEIWAHGLRNPWRFSFDRETGELWLGDVGAGRREEIDLITRGANYGWSILEGSIDFSNPDHRSPEGFAAPLFEYDHDLGKAIVGGYVYRGSRLPALHGSYLYGDFVSGRIWALRRAGDEVSSNDEVAFVESLSSFGEDADGEVYAVSIAGTIYRFEEAAVDDESFPTRLSDTGLFRDTAALDPDPGLIEYDVNSPLWSDGARKRRWLALPGRERITFDATAAWTFPERTVLVKHFELDGAGPGGSALRLETRVLIQHAEGWKGYTYRWNEAQDDADLLETSESVELVVTPGDGSPSTLQTWRFPARTDCTSCHTAAAGRVLGVRTDQIHRSFDYGVRVDEQLRAWNHIRLFTSDLGDTGAFRRLVDPADTSASLDDRARSYLQANCAHCHRPGGPAPGGMDLRIEAGTVELDVIGVRPTSGDLGLPDAYRVKAGNAASSVLQERMRRTDGARMPPVASSVADDSAVDLLGAWIDALD